ncbi:KEOPS complex subunit [Halanaeroarchaeum sp. HSR-CO]|uniref:KEOPS complex subunit Cgi121 n=1 Tax=Halanaeroarchaeum sp. HSR-CO TaxID=2866382 RepID=UPI00217E32A5|nr:KEOPS complex subunit Cgi121 [Halanaeroarchaeum sp. HSR-CO]UWG46382.1 KEOPS complex subunit [Halanaeroarchaeum sp. HSR-CO]
MRVVEGRVHIGEDAPAETPAYASVDAFVAELDGASRPGTAVQAFDARYVAGRRHLETAVEHANRSMERGENVADDRAVEILCYAAGRRQIEQALEMGLEPGTSSVLVVVDGPDEKRVAEEVETVVAPDDAFGQTDPNLIANYFDVTDPERAASDASLQSLVCERVALLDVEK